MGRLCYRLAGEQSGPLLDSAVMPGFSTRAIRAIARIRRSLEPPSDVSIGARGAIVAGAAEITLVRPGA